MPSLNRKAKFPRQAWATKYRRKIEPKLKALGNKLIDELQRRKVPQEFTDYLVDKYGLDQVEKRTVRKLAFDPTADAAALDEMARGVLSAVSFDTDRVVKDMTSDIFQASSKHAFRKMGVEAVWNLDSPAVKTAIATRQNLISNVKETQFTKVKSLLRQQCYDAGGSPVDPKFLEQLRKTTGKASQYEAERIARTETLAVQTQAAHTVYRENGVTEKEWLWSGSGYERHEDLAGVIVGIGDSFPNGLSFPGDPDGEPGEVINCMCDFAPVIDRGFAIDPDEVVTE